MNRSDLLPFLLVATYNQNHGENKYDDYIFFY